MKKPKPKRKPADPCESAVVIKKVYIPERKPTVEFKATYRVYEHMKEDPGYLAHIHASMRANVFTMAGEHIEKLNAGVADKRYYVLSTAAKQTFNQAELYYDTELLVTVQEVAVHEAEVENL